MPKKPSPNRIKRHRVYTVWEAAEAMGLHRETVKRGVQKNGLVADTSLRPWLLEGSDLKTFPEARRRSGQTRLGTGKIFCLPCRAPKFPGEKMAEFRMRTVTTGALVELCPDCGRPMHGIIQRAALPRLPGPGIDCALAAFPDKLGGLA